MSYILDALRRADAERERGAVPSIHAQTVPPASDDAPRPTAAKPMLWLIVALSLALVGSMVWQMAGREAAPPAQPGTAPGTGTIAQTPVTPPAATQPATAAPSLAPVPATDPAPAIVAAPPARQALPPVPPPARAETRATSTDAARPPTTGPAPAAAAANERVPSQSELPENIRREIPQLVVGGSIYSPNPASRFLILNGQIFHENDKVTPDLVLEQIKLKAAVLRYKGHRFGITY